jgi:hypothetical protein
LEEREGGKVREEEKRGKSGRSEEEEERRRGASKWLGILSHRRSPNLTLPASSSVYHLLLLDNR